MEISEHDSLLPKNEVTKEDQLSISPESNLCVLCGVSFFTYGELKEHYDKHCSDVPFECPECSDLFEDLNVFLDHLVKHAPKLWAKLANMKTDHQQNIQDITCPAICSPYASEEDTRNRKNSQIVVNLKKSQNIHQRFLRKSRDEKTGLLPWQANETNFRPYKCKECDRYFTTASSLALHNRRVHLRIKPYKCCICKKTFTQSCNLYKHQTKHSSEKLYTCEQCGLCFTHMHNLKNHQRMHIHGMCKCKYCGQTFKPQGSLIQCCPNCKIPCAHGHALKFHLKRVHKSNEEEKQCSICYANLATPAGFVKHMRKHKSDDAVACEICGRIFAYPTGLRSHKIVHAGKKQYQCSYCGKFFGHAGNLREHLLIHNSDKCFECSICKKKFLKRTYLRNHLKTHTGEKTFNCEYCGKGFTNSSGYLKHKKIHTGERPHKCNICGKAFIQKTHLKMHFRTHTGEKPHQCQVCKKFFKRNDTLRRHLLLHAKNNKNRDDSSTNEEMQTGESSSLSSSDIHKKNI